MNVRDFPVPEGTSVPRLEGVCVFNLSKKGKAREQRYYCGNRPGKERVLRAWSRLI
jgi:hypothetical protein